MADLLGCTALLLAALMTYLLALQSRSIRKVLAVAFIFRASAALLGYYVVQLPDGGGDAISFEAFAWSLGEHGFLEAIANFPGINSFTYAWLMSLLYGVTDRSVLMLQATSVAVGVFSVYLTWRLADDLWGGQVARKAAWLMAVFPSVVQYAALTLREVWVVMFFLLGLIGVVRWARSNRALPAFGAVAAFSAGTIFHGGMFVAVVAFLGLVGSRAVRLWFVGLTRGRVRAFAAVGLMVSVIAIGGYVGSGLSLPKVGTAAQAFDLASWTGRFQSQANMEDAGARYGAWAVPGSPAGLLWIAPVKAVYFLFSPFPWSISNPRHLVGLVDAVLYTALAICCWRNRRRIRSDPGARAVLAIFVALVFAFGIGTGNFGTALRHRAKFVAALLVLAAPRVWRLRIGGLSAAKRRHAQLSSRSMEAVRRGDEGGRLEKF